MTKYISILFFVSLLTAGNCHAQLSWQGGATPEQNQSGIIIFNATGTPLANNTGTLYVHTGVTLNGVAWQQVIGNWGNNTTQPALTGLGNQQYSLNLSPTIMDYYGVTSGNITKINMVVRNAAGNVQTVDLELNVGSFQMNLTNPLPNSITLWTSGMINVQASNTGGAAVYTLKDPSGTEINTATTGDYSYTLNNPVNGLYSLTASRNGLNITQSFDIVVAGTPVIAAMPSQWKDGVNYDTGDFTKAGLVINVPGKDLVYVAGNFNNWSPTSAYLMHKDAVSGKFWLEITGLTPGYWYAFQYWVCDNTPYPDSPAVVKTADPFSTLVLSPFDDPEIISLGVFPGLPEYQVIAPNQSREVTVIQTGNNAFWQYQWTSSNKPNAGINKKDLMIYEVLVRDFGPNRSYQDLIDQIGYLKGLNINAIQLMPVMEFEGNLSWGYNPCYHLAPDKRYGSPSSLKEFIDICHQNGIAVILDIALNHVFGRSPLERMWMIDTDNNGWSDGISPENPYCNVVPMHTGNVGADLNHFREPDNLTNTYVLRTIQEWIEVYRVDGFRWDLTQGFTNSCSENDGGCTGSNLSDRMTKLKWYSDYQWSLDPNFYVIFEHWAFGEIPVYTNYRLSETPAKGIMCWRRADNEFADLLIGYNGNIANTSDPATYRIQGNMESHDEERILYKAVHEIGQTYNEPAKAIARMPAAGSMFFLVPGPKMFWHFAELGWDLTINTCSNGTVNNNCRLDVKPQPQWTENWFSQPARRKIYNDWSAMMKLRTTEPVFKNGQYGFNLTTTGRPRLDIWTSTQPSSSLSYVMVHANFSNNDQTFTSHFPYTGTWYNLMDNSPLQVASTTQDMTIPADGGYLIYGNQPTQTLSIPAESLWENGIIFNPQNPVEDQVTIFYKVKMPDYITFTLYDIHGKILKTTEASGHDDTSSFDFPYPGGVYILEMRTAKGYKVSKLLVKT
ncbi:MAG: alpha-amylase family glycosyl hydrolase [Bacteroidota bacterium]